MLSQTSEYALRAILYLSRKGENGPVRVDDVAAALDVPRNYLSKILHVLARDGILNSTRGPHGGFELAVPASELPLVKVVSSFEPDRFGPEERCVLGRTRCTDADPCAAHEAWKDVSARIRRFFRETTVEELAPEDEETLQAALRGV